jgi:aspartate racemase
MKTIGLIGGISWISTIEYYKLLNEFVNERLGGGEYARCIIHSLNYADVKRNNETNNPQSNFDMVEEACLNMKAGGAEAIILCANTMHIIAEQLEVSIGLPVIHIAKVTAEAINRSKISKVALLGTKFTMELDFFKDKFTDRNIECLIPDAVDREFIHYTIAEELGNNIFKPETKQRYINIIEKMAALGCEGVILGCTEIPLLIKQEDCSIKAFDTTTIHTTAAADFMCA